MELKFKPWWWETPGVAVKILTVTTVQWIQLTHFGLPQWLVSCHLESILSLMRLAMVYGLCPHLNLRSVSISLLLPIIKEILDIPSGITIKKTHQIMHIPILLQFHQQQPHCSQYTFMLEHMHQTWYPQLVLYLQLSTNNDQNYLINMLLFIKIYLIQNLLLDLYKWA